MKSRDRETAYTFLMHSPQGTRFLLLTYRNRVLPSEVFISYHNHFSLDIGHGEYDDSREVLPYEQPALNTTSRIMGELNNTDIIINIGDLAYADGYAAEVC